MMNPSGSYKTKLILSCIVLLIGAGAFAGWFFVSKKQDDFVPRAPVMVEAEPVKVGPISRRVNTNGILTAAQSVALYPEIEGRIAKILFEQGQEVKKGDLLIQLDDSIYQARVSEAKARLEVAKNEYGRAKQLYDKNFGHKSAVEKALAEMRVGQAALQVAQVNLEQTLIRAPFDGIVGLKNISEGGTVARNQELVTVETLSPLYVDFHVPESFLKYIQAGDFVDVTVEGYDSLPLECEVAAINSQADTATHSIQVRAKLENAAQGMRPGQFARVNMELGKEDNAIQVPILAVEEDGGRHFVYIIFDGIAVYTEVTLGLRGEGMVQVTDGLKKGDVVVTVGQIKLSDGMAVRLMSNQPKEDESKEDTPETDSEDEQAPAEKAGPKAAPKDDPKAGETPAKKT